MPSFNIEKRSGTDNWLAVMELPVKLRNSGIAGLPARRFAKTTETGDRKLAEFVARAYAVEWQAKIDSVMSEAKATFWNRKLVEIFGTKEGAAMRDAPTLLTVPLADGRNATVNYETGEPFNDLAPSGQPAVVTASAGGSFGGTRFTKYVDQWLEAGGAKHLQKKQKRMYRSDVLEFAKRFPFVELITDDAVKEWTMEIMAGDNGLKIKTVRRKLDTLRGYWRELQALKKADRKEHPFDGKALNLPKVDAVTGEESYDAYEAADVHKLLHAARTGYRQTVRDDKELKDSNRPWAGPGA